MSYDTTLDVTLRMTEQARRRLTESLDRIRMVRYDYGDLAAAEEATSFALAFGRLVSMGGTIGADGEHSFVAQTDSGLTVGMIWTAEDRRATLRRGRPERESLDGLYSDDELAEMFPVAAGTWSLHS